MKFAVAAGSESAVELYISRGDDLEWRDDRGFTPLMIAASRDRGGVCRLLIDAGVDLHATDSAGRDALAIARDAGASSAAEIIASFVAKSAYQPPVNTENEAQSLLLLSGDKATESPSYSLAFIDAGDTTRALEVGSVVVKSNHHDQPEDYGDWEAESEPAAPAHEPALVQEHSVLQRAISDHVPIDDSADWDDFEAYLPEMAAPLARAENVEFQGALRAIILRAVREGSVPSQALENLYSSCMGDELRDVDAELALSSIIHDLGAEVDERFEYMSQADDFRVGRGNDETEEEREVVDSAIAALSALTARPKDPLRMQRRETQRIALLTAEQEVELAQAMDSAAAAALDAMAAWPRGLFAIATIIDDVREGRRLVSHIAANGQEESEPLDAQRAVRDQATQIALVEDQTDDESVELKSSSASMETMEHLLQFRALAPEAEGHWPASTVVRQALAAVTFRRSFLLELSSVEPNDLSASACSFRKAVAELKEYRDRMTVANLRLVFPLARQFLSSGLPLEDLSQEGNIGLLRAVDRFDWRRGYRFSTMATWWVRQAISRSIPDSSLTIRLPVHAYETVSRAQREVKALDKVLRRESKISEIAAHAGMPVAKFELLMRCISEPLSLESDEYVRELHDQDRGDAFAEAEAREITRALALVLESLDKKGAAIVRLRFGLGGFEPRTLEEIGRIYDVTRERVRQIESKAMRALSHNTRLANLASALGRPNPSAKKRTQDLSPEADMTHQLSAPFVKPTLTSASASLNQVVTSEIDLHGDLYLDVRDLVEMAKRQGIATLVSTSEGVKTTWVFLDQPKSSESLTLASLMMRKGFTYLPGKGYWI